MSNGSEDPDRVSAVNLVMECKDGECKTSHAAWLDTKAAEDGEMYFMNVVLEYDEDQTELGKEMEFAAAEEE
jgi:hypothetical protein